MKTQKTSSKKSGFASPNYTMTPNDFFDNHMRDMNLSELKVVLAIVRLTFGWHREKVQISIRKMAKMTGLSASNVQYGARLAEKHGLIERIIDGQKSTTWRAIVRVSEVSTSTDEVYSEQAQGVSAPDTGVDPKKVKESKDKERVSLENQDQNPPADEKPDEPIDDAERYFRDKHPQPEPTKYRSKDEVLKSLDDTVNRSIASQEKDDYSRWPEDISQDLKYICDTWFFTPPSKANGYWIASVREMLEACDGLSLSNIILDIRSDYLSLIAEKGRVPYTVADPGSLVKMVRAKAGEIRSGRQQLQVKRYDDGSLHI